MKGRTDERVSGGWQNGRGKRRFKVDPAIPTWTGYRLYQQAILVSPMIELADESIRLRLAAIPAAELGGLGRDVRGLCRRGSRLL